MSNLKKIEGGVTTPQGFTAGAVYTAIKKRENKKPDVAVLYSDLPCSCAACFTTNKFCAAPVILDREILKKGKARAVVINSGNANAATGKQGIEDARTVEREAEKLLGLGEDEVFVCSTGRQGASGHPRDHSRKACQGERLRGCLRHHDHRYRPQGVRL